MSNSYYQQCVETQGKAYPSHHDLLQVGVACDRWLRARAGGRRLTMKDFNHAGAKAAMDKKRH